MDKIESCIVAYVESIHGEGEQYRLAARNQLLDDITPHEGTMYSQAPAVQFPSNTQYLPCTSGYRGLATGPSIRCDHISESPWNCLLLSAHLTTSERGFGFHGNPAAGAYKDSKVQFRASP